MKILPTSLTTRIKLTFILSFFVFSLLSLGIIFSVSKLVEDHLFDKQLSHFIKDYKERWKEENIPEVPLSFKVYKDQNAVPTKLLNLVGSWSPSAGELSLNNEFEYHYAIEKMPNDDLYLFLFDVNKLELAQDLEDKIINLIILVFIIFIIFFFIIFKIVLETSIKPMLDLVQHVDNNSGQMTWQHNENLNKQKGEIGLLYKTMSNYAQRSEKLIQRERQFGGFASHELRTPLTIIKGATELLRLDKNITNNNKPLKRIENATNDMQSMINLLLDLSRDDVVTDKVKANDFLPNVVNQYKENPIATGISINVSGSLDPQLEVDKFSLQISINNLLHNAIKFSDDKIIKILLFKNELQILNNFKPNFNQSDRGYGLGLMIIERICENQNWKFHFQSKDDYALANIKFN